QMNSAAISSLSIQAPLVTDYRGVGGAALLLPKKDAIRKAIQQTLSAPREFAEPDSAGRALGRGELSGYVVPQDETQLNDANGWAFHEVQRTHNAGSP